MIIDQLTEILRQAQVRGFLGKGPVDDYITHARAHAAVAFAHEQAESVKCLDLGSGGGVPGLVIAIDNPAVTMTLLERADKRCEFLDAAVAQLGLGESVSVKCADAADAAHDQAHREQYDFVFSRSFGRTALVAECSAGLLIPGGDLVVSEPPNKNSDRWPAEPLAELGLTLIETTTATPHFAVLRKIELCPPDRPRHWSQMVKKPLY